MNPVGSLEGIACGFVLLGLGALMLMHSWKLRGEGIELGGKNELHARSHRALHWAIILVLLGGALVSFA